AAEEHGPARTVVLSHWHGDHVYGAGAFDAVVVATPGTGERVGERTEARLAAFKATPAGEYEGTPFAELVKTELPTLEVRHPDETFPAERTFIGESRTGQAIPYGGGHTASDAFLGLGEERVLFAADLVFAGTPP